MIKLIIFDLDGVLVSTRDMHYESLNLALGAINKRYRITREEHLSTYDGLPTRKKLQLLTENKGLPKELHELIWKSKQEQTADLIRQRTHDIRMAQVLNELNSAGYTVCVASNSIRTSTYLMLRHHGLIEYVDRFYSNEDVYNPKPHPEMYMKAMLDYRVAPSETLIVEDSHIGRKAALASKAHLHAVKNPDDITLDTIQKTINNINEKNQAVRPKWLGKDMNVLIPMAGAGSRFSVAGYTFPKPLIEVNGKAMIQAVVDNLHIDATHTFIVRKEHYERYYLKNFLNAISPGCNIVVVDELTEGAACTSLLAKEYINNDAPLLIANSDQLVEWDSNEFMYSMVGDNIDGGILVFNSSHPKWSYARVSKDTGFVEEVAEKKPISDLATTGIYYWKHGKDYVRYAEQMIEKNIRVNNEFYICPVYNEAIVDDKTIKVFHAEKMWGLGTPEDLEYYLKHNS